MSGFLSDIPIPMDYVKPIDPPPQEECHFYHTMDLPGVGTVYGYWDLRNQFKEYIGGVEVCGKRCLDVGTASGFLSFEMEKTGAEVVSFDVDHPSRIHLLPIHDHLYTVNHAAWVEQTKDYLRKLHGSYWLAHAALGSKNLVYHGDIYRLPPFLGMFQVVVIGQVLVHLANPIQALAQAAARCSDTLIIVEGTQRLAWDTTGKMPARASTGGPPYIWWHLSVPLYRELLAMMDFELIAVYKRRFTCERHEYVSGKIRLTTMVAKRKS